MELVASPLCLTAERLLKPKPQKEHLTIFIYRYSTSLKTKVTAQGYLKLSFIVEI